MYSRFYLKKKIHKGCKVKVLLSKADVGIIMEATGIPTLNNVEI